MNYAPVCSGIRFSAIMDLHEVTSELLTMDFCKEKADRDFCSVTQDQKNYTFASSLSVFICQCSGRQGVCLNSKISPF